MLILGLVLVQTIFTGAKYNVEQLDEKVRAEINKLFEEDSKLVVYLANNIADVKQGDTHGVAFALRNIEKDTTESTVFNYQVTASDISSSCRGLTVQEAEDWIKSRATGTFDLPPGDISHVVVRFSIPESAPLCIVPYNIIVKDQGGTTYATGLFDIEVK